MWRTARPYSQDPMSELSIFLVAGCKRRKDFRGQVVAVAGRSRNRMTVLEGFAGIEQDGDRALVYQLNLHHFLEAPGLTT